MTFTFCAAVDANSGHLAGLGVQLGNTCVQGFGSGRPVNVFLGIPVAYGALAMTVLTIIMSLRRALPFPLGRVRMASVLATYTQVYGLALLIVGTSFTTVLTLALLHLLGEPVRWLDLTLPVACLIALVPTFLFSLAIEAMARGRAGIVIWSVIALLCPFLVVTGASFFVGPLLSFPGVTACMTTTLACWAFHRWVVRRSYLTSDLDGSTSSAKELFWGSRD